MTAELRSRSIGLLLACLVLTGCFLVAPSSMHGAESLPATARTVLIVVGPSNHPPGTHEEAAGARLLQHCLRHAENVSDLKAVVVNQWPHDDVILAEAATVVLIGDQFPGARLENSDRVMLDLTRMMARGCGMVCIHYATGLTEGDVAEDGEHPLLHWIGGYFATGCAHHQSVARVMDATIEPAAVDHPVLRGWKRFSLRDEPYYNNYFGPGGMAKNVVPLATSWLPPEQPKEEVVAWGVQRDDGGRGMGIVMPHFYRSWEEDDLRKLILNGIVWSAGLDVPGDGVTTQLPDLNSFEPQAVAPPRN